MTLLDSITAATPAAASKSGGSGATADSTISRYPIVLEPELKPSPESPTSTLIAPISAATFSPSPISISLCSAATDFAGNLKTLKTLTPASFHNLLSSFLRSLSETLTIPIPSDSTDASISASIDKLAFAIPASTAAAIADHCITLESYQILESLISNRLLAHQFPPNFLENLAIKHKSDLICLFLARAAGLRSGELLAALRYFLSPPSDAAYDSMAAVRKNWEKVALSAIKKCNKKDLPKKVAILAREAAVLLMMGHDGFSSPEVCLHYLFGSEDIDALVLGSAIARLDGLEVVELVRYLVKWLDKYWRFPEAQPCPSAGEVLGLEECQSVLSIETVVRVLGLVLDEHFSFLVLNPEFREEIRAAGEVVKSLALEAELCGPMAGVIGHIQAGTRMEKDA